VRLLDQAHFATDGGREESRCPAHIPLDFAAKARLLWVSTATFLVAAPPGPNIAAIVDMMIAGKRVGQA
jgi:hypothetical protein